MYKSRQKAIGVAAISIVVLSAFAIGSWAIIDASYKNPRGDAKLSYYSGVTQYLNRGGTMDGSLNVNSLSINDWINLNMPTKVLFEKTNTGFDGYYYTFDDNSKAPTTKDDLKKLNDDVNAKAFIAKVSFSISGSSYSYSVFTKDFLNNKEIELGNLNLTFTDSNFTKLKSIISKTPTSDFSSDFVNDKLTIGSYSLEYKNDSTNENNISYSFNVNSNVSNSLFFGTSINVNNSGGPFSIKSISGTGTNDTIISSYAIQQNSSKIVDGDTSKELTIADNETSIDNFLIYNVSHSLGSTPLTTRVSYMSNWRALGENQFAKFHLPNEIGLFPILTPFGIKKQQS